MRLCLEGAWVDRERIFRFEKGIKKRFIVVGSSRFIFPGKTWEFRVGFKKWRGWNCKDFNAHRRESFDDSRLNYLLKLFGIWNESSSTGTKSKNSILRIISTQFYFIVSLNVLWKINHKKLRLDSFKISRFYQFTF